MVLDPGLSPKQANMQLDILEAVASKKGTKLTKGFVVGLRKELEDAVAKS